MKLMTLATIIMAVAASFLVGTLWAQGATGGLMNPTTGQFTPYGEPFGPVLTGADIGLQRIAAPEGRDGAIPVRWMVKINGQWRQATQAIQATQISH